MSRSSSKNGHTVKAIYAIHSPQFHKSWKHQGAFRAFENRLHRPIPSICKRIAGPIADKCSVTVWQTLHVFTTLSLQRTNQNMIKTTHPVSSSSQPPLRNWMVYRSLCFISPNNVYAKMLGIIVLLLLLYYPVLLVASFQFPSWILRSSLHGLWFTDGDVCQIIQPEV